MKVGINLKEFVPPVFFGEILYFKNQSFPFQSTSRSMSSIHFPYNHFYPSNFLMKILYAFIQLNENLHTMHASRRISGQNVTRYSISVWIASHNNLFNWKYFIINTCYTPQAMREGYLNISYGYLWITLYIEHVVWLPRHKHIGLINNLAGETI